MKFIITENKVNEIILKQINIMYDINDFGWTPGIDEWGNEVDYAYKFYVLDYDDDDNTIFRWYSEEYWTTDEGNEWGERFRNDMLSKSPMLVFDSDSGYNNLEGLFGNRWKPIFMKWFEDNFELPVKTITR